MASQANLSLLNGLAYLLSQQGTQEQGSTKRKKKVKYCSATCPDPQCHTKLYFPSHEPTVECTNCGQRHTVSNLPDKEELKEQDKVGKFGVELAQLRQVYSGSKKTPELVKVKGISNYQCKLLSPLLTTYGMDSKLDRARPLTALGMGDVFDCSKLASRAFQIEEAQLGTIAYGRDRSGSARYLSDTLQQLKVANGNRESLIPVHADGDGHCLVHAVSRCVMGRELFWHALRTNLHQHFVKNKDRYMEEFKDFYGEEDWPNIIAEAAADFQPPEGQERGLCNIHIFGLANVLRRPIILLDSLTGMQSSGDYSGIFLPTLHTPEECSSKDASGALRPNSPIVVAWSSSGRNHFIPLVPIKGNPLPKLPPQLRPKVWGQPEEVLQKYVVVDVKGAIELCGGKALGDSYLQKLVACMEKLFFEKNGVLPAIVADVNQYVYKSAGYVGVSPETITVATKNAVEESRLFRCLICSAVSCVPPDWLHQGGMLYEKATDRFDLTDGMQYSFPLDGIMATYVAGKDCFIPFQVSCFWCTNISRPLGGDGSIAYENGDRTATLAVGSKCGCGFKHYWNGKEYDNLPEKIPLKLTWGKTISINVHWFQYESDPDRNSNVYEVAQKAVTDHFPGEFGSERLVQQVVDQILLATERRENIQQVEGHHPTQQGTGQLSMREAGGVAHEVQQGEQQETLMEESSLAPPTKFILKGHKSKTLHKEELTVSEAERNVKKRIEENAKQQQQRKKTGPMKREAPGSGPTGPRVSPPPPSGSHPPSHPSPPSPSSGRPAQKKIRVTSSDGKTANLSLDPSVTFSQLQAAIERELSIPPEKQRLRSGYPPRELKPSSEDPSLPVNLANGERVSVDIIGPVGGVAGAEAGLRAEAGSASSGGGDERAQGGGGRGRGKSEEEKAQQSINTILQQMLGEVDLWSLAQHQPQLFRKGGDYYEQVMRSYGSQLKDHTHFQFKEFSDKTFSYNAQKECLEICLGMDHVAVGPLTPQQEELARAASVTSTDQSQQTPSTQQPEATSHGVGGAVNRPAQTVKAFSGKGHSLMDTSPSAIRRAEGQEMDPLLEAAQLVVQKRLVTLQSRERELQTQVRAINRQLVHAEANKDGASVRDDVLTTLESKLLDFSSELKQVREQIRELTTLQ